VFHAPKRCRWTGDASTRSLEVASGDDPLACLDGGLDGDASALQRLHQIPAAPEGGEEGSRAGALVMTDGARQLLAVVAPWLRDAEPFLLVKGCRNNRGGSKLGF
jgi:hypothetical protein